MEIKCSICGEVRDKLVFVIGASKEPDWVMHEGTGKITCPTCHPIGVAEAQAVIDNYVKN